MSTWTYQKRLKLYKALVNDFGSYRNWTLFNSPSKEKEKEYEEFCINIAKTLGMNSNADIKTEIYWARGMRLLIDKTQMKTWFESKCAALVTGFIDDSYMPTKLNCEYDWKI